MFRFLWTLWKRACSFAIVLLLAIWIVSALNAPSPLTAAEKQYFRSHGVAVK